MKKIILKISQTRYVKAAIEENSDLSAFKKRPDFKIILGISAILFSFLIGWPAVAVMGALAIALKKPLILAVFGPLIYGLSHLIFIFGMYLAGSKYTAIFFKWLTKISIIKLMIKFNVPHSFSMKSEGPNHKAKKDNSL